MESYSAACCFDYGNMDGRVTVQLFKDQGLKTAGETGAGSADGRRAAGAFLALMLSAGGILYRYYAVYPFVRDARFLTRSLSYRY